MAEILETLKSNGELGKVLYELFGQLATSAVLKQHEKNGNSKSSMNDQTVSQCKSVPLSSKVVAVDCRNHGQSRRHSHMSYPIMAGDIAKTFHQLNISRAIVIGHSVGSKVAMEFALSMPDSVEKLILEDLPPMVVPAPLIPGVLSAMLNLDLSQVSSINYADDKLKEPIPPVLSDDESGKSRGSNRSHAAVVDESLGRPRYHWNDSETDVRSSQRSTPDVKQLYSVYVGHLPKDITQGELEDLFCDIGEVVNVFVSPLTDGHTYTYGFVRFYTLEEATNAVRKKNLKILGNRQINVELSSSTRRNLQANSEDDDTRPLLQKEYPRVQRPSDKNEKEVVEKIKASLRRLKTNNIPSLGNCNPDKLFEDFKTVLKMLINHPMKLAEPSFDTSEDKNSWSDSACNDFQILRQNDLNDTTVQRNSRDVVQEQNGLLTQLPTSALEVAKNTGVDCSTSKSFLARKDTSPDSGCLVEKNDSSISEVVTTSASSGEDNSFPRMSMKSARKAPVSKYSLSASSTDDEQHMSDGRTMSENVCKSPTRPIAYKPSSTSGENNQAEHIRSTDRTFKFRQVEAGDHFTVHQDKQKYDSVYDRTSPRISKYASRIPSANALSDLNISLRQSSCVEAPTGTKFVSNAPLLSNSQNEDTFSSSGGVTSMISQSSLRQCSEDILNGRPHDTATAIRGCSGSDNEVLHGDAPVPRPVPQSSGTVGQSSCTLTQEPGYGINHSCVLPNFSEQVFTGVGSKDVQEGKGDVLTQNFGFLDGLYEQNAATRNNSLFPSPPRQNTSQEYEDRSINHIPARTEGKEISKTTSPYSLYSDISYFSSNSETEKTSLLSLRNVEDSDFQLPWSNQTKRHQHPETRQLHDEECINVNSGGQGNKSSTFNVDGRKTKLANQHIFPLQDMEVMETGKHHLSSGSKAFTEGSAPHSFQDAHLKKDKELPCVSEQNVPDVLKSNVSQQQNGLSNQVNEVPFPNSGPIKTVQSQLNCNFVKHSENNEKQLRVARSSLQKSRILQDSGDSSKDIAVVNKQMPQDITPSSLSISATEVVNQSSQQLKDDCHSMRYALQSREDSSISNGTSSCEPTLSRNSELEMKADGANLSSPVLLSTGSIADDRKMKEDKTIRSTDSINLANKNGPKSPVRRLLAPSFLLSPSKKDHEDKLQRYSSHDKAQPRVESPRDNMHVNNKAKSQSIHVFEVLAEEPVSEPSPKSLLDSVCFIDDAETSKLKGQLRENILKLDEFQQTLNMCPQRGRRKLADVFGDHSHRSKLERKIHDIEILLQKETELWAARSNERELAYEKELFHCAEDNPLLNQFVREMKKDSLQKEIHVTELKCKILQLKIEQWQPERLANA